MLRRIGSAVLGLALIAAAPSGLAQGTAEPTSESQRAPEAGEQSQRAPDAGEKAGGDQTASQPADADRLISAINAIEGAIRDLVFDENPEARKRQERRDEADLRAQQDMALWALRMFWAAIGSLGLTFVGIVLIGITLFYTKEAAQAAKASVDEATKGTAAAAQAAAAALEANKLNRDVFVAEQRAWIAIKSVQIVSSLEWPNRYGKVSIKFILRNIGRTPS